MADVPGICLGLTVDAGSKHTYEEKLVLSPHCGTAAQNLKPVQNLCVSSNSDG